MADIETIQKNQSAFNKKNTIMNISAGVVVPNFEYHNIQNKKTKQHDTNMKVFNKTAKLNFKKPEGII